MGIFFTYKFLHLSSSVSSDPEWKTCCSLPSEQCSGIASNSTGVWVPHDYSEFQVYYLFLHHRWPQYISLPAILTPDSGSATSYLCGQHWLGCEITMNQTHAGFACFTAWLTLFCKADVEPLFVEQLVSQSLIASVCGLCKYKPNKKSSFSNYSPKFSYSLRYDFNGTFSLFQTFLVLYWFESILDSDS